MHPNRNVAVNLLLTVLLVFMFLLYLANTTASWRGLILLIIPIGFVQEPIRKLIPEQPVAVQLAVVAVFALALVLAVTRLGMPTLRPLSGQNANTRKVILLFICLVLAHSLHSFIRFQTLFVPLIGILSYLLPIPALWLAYVYVRNVSDIRRFLVLYAAAAVPMILSVLASYKGVDDAVFRQIGDAPMVVYHQAVGVVELYCGFLRSPDIAAWHTAIAACSSIVVALSFRGIPSKVFASALVPISIYAIILTGRRKALVILALFALIYLMGMLLSRWRSSRVAALVTTVVAVALFAGVLYMAPEQSVPNPYLERTATIAGDVQERFEKLGIQTISWAYAAGGIIGLGTGAGAQGTQHIAGVALQGSAEGGLGRIMLELGAAGLILAILCAVAVAKTVRGSIAAASRHSPVLFKLELGVIAIVAANVPIFVGAAQIFGDPFVLLILGINLGFVLAAPRVIMLEERRREAARIAGLGASAR